MNSSALHLADRNVGGRLLELRRLGHPAAVGHGHAEIVAVQMDRMVGHGEIAHPDAHAVVEPDRQARRCREHAEFHVHMLKSVISVTFGSDDPGVTS